jgi:peptidyl-tRNA hydrolase
VLVASGNARTPAIRIELEYHAVTDKDFDTVQTHFAGQVCKNTLSAFKLHAKKSVRKRLIDNAFDNLGFGHIGLRGQQ